jgi:hypothetical protein
MLLVLTVANLGVLLWTFRQWQLTRSALMFFVLLPLAALPYDSLIAGLGRWIGIGDTLRDLSGVPLAWWYLTLPLSLFAFATLCRRVGFAWARIDWGHGAVCIAAVLMVVYQMPRILTIKALYPACWQDTLRYVPSVLRAEACDAGQAGIHVPSVPSYVPWIVFGLFAAGGIGLWRRKGWPWLAAGMLPGLALMLLPGSSVGPVPAFFGKALVFWSMAITMVHYGRLFPPAPPAAEGGEASP